MFRSIVFILLFILSYSCNNSPQAGGRSDKNNFRLKKVADEFVDTASSICFGNKQLVLLTKCKNNVELDFGRDSIYYLRWFNQSGDTLIQDSVKTFRKKEYLNNLLNEKKGAACFDSLDSYPYKYDNIFPSRIALDSNEKITLVRNDVNISACLSYNNSTLEGTLHVLSNEKVSSLKVINPFEDADFFLFDVMGDSCPEIFLVKHIVEHSSYSGDTPLIELQIYKID